MKDVAAIMQITEHEVPDMVTYYIPMFYAGQWSAVGNILYTCLESAQIAANSWVGLYPTKIVSFELGTPSEKGGQG